MTTAPELHPLTGGDPPGVDPPGSDPPGLDPPGAGADAHPQEERYEGPSLSPSRAGDFVQCPLLYRFRVVDRLPELPSAQAARGSLVHAVLERLFDLAPAERDLAAATALVPPAWAAAVEERPELTAMFGDDDALRGWLASADALLARYFWLEDPQRLEPAERELYVETDLASGLRLRGYVDRLDVAPSGLVRVVDYKTGRSPGVGFEARAFFQMRFYALVLWRTRGVVPAVLQLMYLADGEVLRYTPTAEDLLATERKVEAIWAAIAMATQTGEWQPSPGRQCDWCSHKALCPAWGGTPPPLPAPPPPPPLPAPPPPRPGAPGPGSAAGAAVPELVDVDE